MRRNSHPRYAGLAQFASGGPELPCRRCGPSFRSMRRTGLEARLAGWSRSPQRPRARTHSKPRWACEPAVARMVPGCRSGASVPGSVSGARLPGWVAATGRPIAEPAFSGHEKDRTRRDAGAASPDREALPSAATRPRPGIRRKTEVVNVASPAKTGRRSQRGACVLRGLLLRGDRGARVRALRADAADTAGQSRCGRLPRCSRQLCQRCHLGADALPRRAHCADDRACAGSNRRGGAAACGRAETCGRAEKNEPGHQSGKGEAAASAPKAMARSDAGLCVPAVLRRIWWIRRIRRVSPLVRAAADLHQRTALAPQRDTLVNGVLDAQPPSPPDRRG